MRTHFPELVRFRFGHDYYRAVGDAFIFAPQKQTRRLLQRCGLLFRPTGDGFTILYQAVKDDTDTLVPMRQLPEQFALRFWICPKFAFNGIVSALPQFRSFRQTLYFDNLVDRKDADTLYLNHDAPDVTAAGAADLVDLAPGTWRYTATSTEPVFVRIQNASGAVIASAYGRPYEGRVRCLIDLDQIDPGLIGITAGSQDTETFYRPESLPDLPPLAAVDLYNGPFVPEAYRFVDADGEPQFKVYTCRIAGNSSTWRYIVVPRFNPTLQAGQLSIRDGDARYTFGSPAAVQTMSGEAAFAIESEGLIPNREASIKGLALRRNNADLIKELPNPGPDQIMAGESGFISEIYLYV